jgi:hypothetical protein
MKTTTLFVSHKARFSDTVNATSRVDLRAGGSTLNKISSLFTFAAGIWRAKYNKQVSTPLIVSLMHFRIPKDNILHTYMLFLQGMKTQITQAHLQIPSWLSSSIFSNLWEFGHNSSGRLKNDIHG